MRLDIKYSIKENFRVYNFMKMFSEIFPHISQRNRNIYTEMFTSVVTKHQLNLGLQQEQQMLLTAEPCLQPSESSFYYLFWTHFGRWHEIGAKEMAEQLRAEDLSSFLSAHIRQLITPYHTSSRGHPLLASRDTSVHTVTHECRLGV